ncbi:MAG: NAD(P)-dependent oxidoreductase [Proteobacteria bacterium]|nr:MAG: NAD(P)-dependent oxidoreductase [Pseudomonadota bacterium]
MATLPNIAWIGAGRMGIPMAGFILQAGYPLMVYSRSAANRQKLSALGAKEATTINDCVRAADVIFSSLPDDNALREVTLGAQGILASAKRGAIFADTSTVSTDISSAVDREAAQRGIAYLRIPISGNAASAQKGEVTALVSGPEEAWSRVRPIVESFSKAQIYMGAGEQARYMKLVVNLIVVNLAQSLAEALALGRKAGLDWNLMLDTVAQSTIASPWVKIKASLLKQRDFTPTMTTRLILKDIDLMLAEARAKDVCTPLTAMTRQIMQSLIGAGFEQDDYMAVVKLAEQQSGLSTEAVE